MSITALVAGALMYLLFRDRPTEVKASPVIGRLQGRRTFEAVLAVIVTAARWLEALLGTRRPPPHLRLLVCLALVAARKSTRLNSSHLCATRMPSSACKNKKHSNSIH